MENNKNSSRISGRVVWLGLLLVLVALLCLANSSAGRLQIVRLVLRYGTTSQRIAVLETLTLDPKDAILLGLVERSRQPDEEVQTKLLFYIYSGKHSRFLLNCSVERLADPAVDIEEWFSHEFHHVQGLSIKFRAKDRVREALIRRVSKSALDEGKWPYVVACVVGIIEPVQEIDPWVYDGLSSSNPNLVKLAIEFIHCWSFDRAKTSTTAAPCLPDHVPGHLLADLQRHRPVPEKLRGLFFERLRAKPELLNHLSAWQFAVDSNALSLEQLNQCLQRRPNRIHKNQLPIFVPRWLEICIRDAGSIKDLNKRRCILSIAHTLKEHLASALPSLLKTYECRCLSDGTCKGVSPELCEWYAVAWRGLGGTDREFEKSLSILPEASACRSKLLEYYLLSASTSDFSD